MDAQKKKFLKIILPFVLCISIFTTIFSFRYNPEEKKEQLDLDIPESIHEEFYDIFQQPQKLLDLIRLRNELQNSIKEINLIYELIKNPDNSLNSIENKVSSSEFIMLNNKLKENKELKQKIIQLELDNKHLIDESEQNQINFNENNNLNLLEEKNKLILETEFLQNQIHENNVEKIKILKDFQEIQNEFIQTKNDINFLIEENENMKKEILSLKQQNISDQSEEFINK